MWLDLVTSGSDLRTLMMSPKCECTASTHACADPESVGMGRFVRLPDSNQLFFQKTFSRAQTLALFPWLPPDCSLQPYIAMWEIAQCALLLMLHQLLRARHLPVHAVFRSDNSAAEPASRKGLGMAKGLCTVLRAVFVLQERLSISVPLDHVPGISHDLADALKRDANPSDLGFLPF